MVYHISYNIWAKVLPSDACDEAPIPRTSEYQCVCSLGLWRAKSVEVQSQWADNLVFIVSLGEAIRDTDVKLREEMGRVSTYKPK